MGHLVIAGTGRAGTSFLVEFLHACGLETAVGRAPYYERARAGHETRLSEGAGLPRVVKDPWLFEYCDAVDPRAVPVDVLVVPMRELEDAARSRIGNEREALRRAGVPGWRELRSHAPTPGGVVTSLEVADQARVLAVGFHRLMRWAARHDIPVVLLDYPRLVADAGHVVDALWPWIEPHADRATALAAHARTVRPAGEDPRA